MPCAIRAQCTTSSQLCLFKILRPSPNLRKSTICHGSDQIRHVTLLVGHVTSLSVTLSERVLVSPKSCALLDFLSFLFSLEFLYLEQPLEPQTSCARAVTLLINNDPVVHFTATTPITKRSLTFVQKTSCHNLKTCHFHCSQCKT